MAKMPISETDLLAIFMEKLRAFDECGNVEIAIVPDEQTWRAVLIKSDRTTNSSCRRRMEFIQKQLREVYVLEGG